MEKIKLLVIAGPTCSGKSRLALDCANSLKGEIVSADSMQIYRQMDIGSAKPTKEEMQSVPHHMIDFLSPFEPYTVSLYQRQAREAIADIHKRGKVPVVAGGTGLYISSLLYEMDFSYHVEEKVRDRLNKQAEEGGILQLYETLKQVDPASAQRISPNDAKRIIRALEVYQVSGEPIARNQGQHRYELYDPTIICLNMDRGVLYQRINRRVDLMLEAGLLQEVEDLIRLGCTAEMQSMKGIGYKELIAYFRGATSLEDAVEQIKKGSRNYAKRQITWFKRYSDAVWLDSSHDFSSLAEEVVTLFRR